MDPPVNDTKDGNNPAVSENSIAHELLNLVSVHGYARKVPVLKLSEMVMPYNFEFMSMSKTHWVDDSDCYIVSHARNPDCLFTIFGRFSSQAASDVQDDLLHSIEQESELFIDIGSDYLNQLGMSLSVWPEDMSSPVSFGDELCLFALARHYNRHVLVHTKMFIWCTIDNSESMSEKDIIKSCHLHLIYHGQSLFGIVRKKMSLIDEFLYPDVEPSSPKNPRCGHPKKPKPDLFAYRKFKHVEQIPVNVPPMTQHKVTPPVTATISGEVSLPSTSDKAVSNALVPEPVPVLPIPQNTNDLDILAALQNAPDITTNYNIGNNIDEHTLQGSCTMTSGLNMSPPGLTTLGSTELTERLIVTPPATVPDNMENSACEVVTPTSNLSQMDVTDPTSTSDNVSDNSDQLLMYKKTYGKCV